MGTFGQRLKDLRNSRGISQNELSKHIGVSKSSVNMYERDEREPGFETLEAIADFFNVNMDYLLGRGPVMRTNTTLKLKSGQIELSVNLDEKQFSKEAQPSLLKLIAALNGVDPNNSESIEYLRKIRSEAEESFSPEDVKQLNAFVKTILDMLDSLPHVANFTQSPQVSPAPQEKDTTPAADGPETASEGE